MCRKVLQETDFYLILYHSPKANKCRLFAFNLFLRGWAKRFGGGNRLLFS